MNRGSAKWLVMVCVTLLCSTVIFGCSDKGGTSQTGSNLGSNIGVLDGPCKADGTCNSGLSCKESKCVAIALADNIVTITSVTYDRPADKFIVTWSIPDGSNIYEYVCKLFKHTCDGRNDVNSYHPMSADTYVPQPPAQGTPVRSCEIYYDLGEEEFSSTNKACFEVTPRGETEWLPAALGTKEYPATTACTDCHGCASGQRCSNGVCEAAPANWCDDCKLCLSDQQCTNNVCEPISNWCDANNTGLCTDPCMPCNTSSKRCEPMACGTGKQCRGGVCVESVTTSKVWSLSSLGVKRTPALLSAGGAIYAGTIGGGGVFKSTNSGTNWSAINTGLTNLSIVTLISVDNALYAGAWGGGSIFKSINGGTNWSVFNTGLTNFSVPVLLSVGSDIYAGTMGGVFKSTNGGNWSAINNGLPNPLPDVESLLSAGGAIYAGTYGNGIFKSTNGGSWSAINNGLTNPNDLHVMSLLSVDNAIYAGTRGGGIFKSIDNGTSWTAFNTGLTNLNVHVLLSVGSDIYAGTMGGGVFKSTNGGNWSAINDGLPSPLPYVESLLSVGSDIYAGTYGGIYIYGEQ